MTTLQQKTLPIPSEIRKILVKLYPTADDAKRICDDARLNIINIATDGATIDFWHRILSEARNQTNGLHRLIDVVVEERENPELIEIFDKFCKRAGIKRQVPIICIGSVYLDVRIVGSVGQDDNERYYLDSNNEVLRDITISPGGSVYYVAKHLSIQKRQSHILSCIGAGRRTFAQLFRDLADEDGMSKAVEHISPITAQTTAITVLFSAIDHRQLFLPMVTDRAVLQSVNWEQLEVNLQKLLNEKVGHEKGAIYISGFFKTGLHREIERNITRLKTNNTIFFDHGRVDLSIEENRSRLRQLIDVLCQIDVYFITKHELDKIISIRLPDAQKDEKKSVEKIVDKLLTTVRLPKKMVVMEAKDQTVIHWVGIRRDNKYDFDSVQSQITEVSMGRIIETNNAFNAAFIDSYLELRETNNLHRLMECVRIARNYMLSVLSGG